MLKPALSDLSNGIGVDIFAKSANWITADAFPAQHYQQLLADAIAVNMNMAL